MENIIIFAGIWIVILPQMKWNDFGKKISSFHLVTGLYTCISTCAYMINNEMFKYIWIQLAYIMMSILLVLEIAIKLKKQKVALDVLAMLTAILGLILSVFVFSADPKEISSSIIMIVGSMIILSIPFYKVASLSVKSGK